MEMSKDVVILVKCIFWGAIVSIVLWLIMLGVFWLCAMIYYGDGDISLSCSPPQKHAINSVKPQYCFRGTR